MNRDLPKYVYQQGRLYPVQIKGKWVGSSYTVRGAIKIRDEFCIANDIPIPDKWSAIQMAKWDFQYD